MVNPNDHEEDAARLPSEDGSWDDGGAMATRREMLVLAAIWLSGGLTRPLVQGDGPEPMTGPSSAGSPRDRPEKLSSPLVRNAAPGTVQTVLADAAAASQSRVMLQTETTYRPTQTWEIPSGVTLDYNGALVVPQADVDLHDIQPGGCVERPLVDLRQVGSYSSTVFRIDSSRHGFYGENPMWHVRGGFTRGRQGEGTLFEFVQGGESAIYFVHADHAVRGIGTVVDMHRGDRFGINGVRITGVWHGFETGIRMRNRTALSEAVDNISGNHFDVIAQPDSSEILWDLEAGKFNILRGRVWDYSEYDDVLWRIHDVRAQKRIGNLFYWFPVGSFEDRLVEKVGPDVFDDRLGEPRNRVIIPWLQGRPVGDFDD